MFFMAVTKSYIHAEARSIYEATSYELQMINFVGWRLGNDVAPSYRHE